MITTTLTPEQVSAADWLESNWESVVRAAALTARLRERFGIEHVDAFKVIGEGRQRLGK